MENTEPGMTPLDDLTYEQLVELASQKWGQPTPVDNMMDNLIACFGEISAFNDALLEHPEYSELSGMTGIAEIVIDRIINRFERMVEENNQ